MNFRLANINDLDNIVGILNEVIKNKHEGSNWDENYPNREVLRNDIVKGDMVVLEEDANIIGIIVLNEEQDSSYKTIEWGDNFKALVIHRLFVSTKVRGKSIGKELVIYAMEFAKSKGYISIRLDTYINNILAQKLYESLGFDRRGIIKLEGYDDEFIAYEKIL